MKALLERHETSPTPQSTAALGSAIVSALASMPASPTEWEDRLLATALLTRRAETFPLLSADAALRALHCSMAHVALEIAAEPIVSSSSSSSSSLFAGHTLHCSLSALHRWVDHRDASPVRIRAAAENALGVFGAEPRCALRDAAQTVLDRVLFGGARGIQLRLAAPAARLFLSDAALHTKQLRARPRRVASTVQTWLALLGATAGQRANRPVLNALASAVQPLLRNRDTAVAVGVHCAWIALVVAMCTSDAGPAKRVHLETLTEPLLRGLTSSRVAVRSAALYAWCAVGAAAALGGAPVRDVAEVAVLPGLQHAARDTDAGVKAAALDALVALVRDGDSGAAQSTPTPPLAAAASGGGAAAGGAGAAAATTTTTTTTTTPASIAAANRALFASLGAPENLAQPLVPTLLAEACALSQRTRDASSSLQGVLRELLLATDTALHATVSDAVACAERAAAIAATAAVAAAVVAPVPSPSSGSASSLLVADASASSSLSSLASPAVVPPIASAALPLPLGVRRHRQLGARPSFAPQLRAQRKPPPPPLSAVRAWAGAGAGARAAAGRVPAVASRSSREGFAVVATAPRSRATSASGKSRKRRCVSTAACMYTTLEPSQPLVERDETFDYG